MACPVLFFRYVEKNPTQCIQDQSKCNTYKLPRNYVAHHLNGRQINIDGRLDEEAWREVPWTKNFTDIRSTVYPVPYLDTRVKIRYVVFTPLTFLLRPSKGNLFPCSPEINWLVSCSPKIENLFSYDPCSQIVYSFPVPLKIWPLFPCSPEINALLPLSPKTPRWASL